MNDINISNEFIINNEINEDIQDYRYNRYPRVRVNMHDDDSDSDGESIDDSEDELTNEKKCPICLDIIYLYDRCNTKCLHEFHTSCLLKIKKNECPLCRSKLYDEDIEDIEDDEAVKDINDFYDHIQIIMDNAERNNYNRGIINDDHYDD